MNTPPLPPIDSEQPFAAFTPAQLLDRLVQEEDRASRELFDACVAQGEAMVEALHAVIYDDERPWGGDAPGEWWLMLHAAFILGRMPTPSAGALLVRLMQRMDEHEDENMQDWLAGDWPFLFAGKPSAVIDAVREFAEHAGRSWYFRCQAVDVVLDAGMREGEAALEAAIDWAAALAGDESDEWMFRTVAACTLLDFPRARHRALLEAIGQEETRRMKAKRWSIGGAFAVEDVDSAFAKSQDTPDWRCRRDPWMFYDPDEIATRQRRWQEEDARAEAREREEEYLPATYVRATPKIGRNDPCPCGSGKKYKRCCLANDEAIAPLRRA